jgi:NAD-dependent deacetylase
LNFGDFVKTKSIAPRISFGLAKKFLRLMSHNTCRSADYFAVIGTSLQVYPAAGLIDFTPQKIPYILIKAYKIQISEIHWRLFLVASKGVEIMRKNLLHKLQ